jgi:cephalosporin hydroxylase
MKLNYKVKYDPTKMLVEYKPKTVSKPKRPVRNLVRKQLISPIPEPQVLSLQLSQNPPIFNSSLEKIVDNSRTDKNTLHSYLPLYQKLLVSKKKTAKNVLEIGICNGGSIKLWSDYFINANVYGLDIIDIETIWEGIKNKHNIKLYTSTDAYNDNFFINKFLSKNIKFDFMLDDGPHTLESMKKFINLYSQIMTDDGILIIEDVQSWDWIDVLKNEVPENLKQFIKVYDLRPNKNRYDDIVFTIDKLNI